MPKKDHNRNILKGRLTKYSWKNAETKKTQVVAPSFDTPALINGL